MINTNSGTPFVGYASLTPGAPGPVAITLFTVMGATAYALQSTERCYITNVTISSGDTATNLITIDSGGTTPTKFVSAYVSQTKVLSPLQIPPGVCRGIAGVVPRATAAAVSGATVEIIVKGFISRT